VLVRKSTPDRVLAEIQGTGGKVIKTSLTSSNCDQLLFDDVLWVENAKRDHFDFISKMRDRGIEVVEMHNLLAETVAVPEGKK
jgi:arginine deiminase